MKSRFANCVLQVARFGLIASVIFVGFASLRFSSASASSASDDRLSFCHFGPKVTVISDGHSTASSDSCEDRVHVQGVLWRCGSAENVATNKADFLSQLNRLAEEECREHCANIGSQCKAIYSNTPECGLGTDRESAVSLGKKLGCGPDCEGGTAFTYCSLFNAGFTGKGTDAVRSEPYNCECRSRS